VGPAVAGYVSKWYLQKGAIQAGEEWVALVLGASSLLNAAYFLPILYRAWFNAPPEHWPAEHRVGFLLAMAGNFGLIPASDVPTFYACFTLMGWHPPDWCCIAVTPRPCVPDACTWPWRCSAKC
jgi:NADH:ubiquinone oxidoreductase subunit 2 (subunit N)